MIRRLRAILAGSTLFALLCVQVLVPTVYASQTTAPMKMMYDGRLLDTSGNAITAAHTLRFSLWIIEDVEEEHFDSDGEIDETATGFSG